jgi:ATP-binding cassette subfamily G (WHITE) protein 2 (PDR)
MSDEKLSEACSSRDEPGSSIENEVMSTKLREQQTHFSQNPALTTGKEVSGLSYDPRDTTLDQWALDKHLHAITKDLQQHSLPPMSSRSCVIWKDLLVRGAGAGIIYQQSVGQIIRGPLNTIQNLTLHGKPPERAILHNVEGVLREGEMLLVLGRPGSGCSTLLKTLCGLTDEYLGWQGDVRYNGVNVETFKKRFRGDAVYTPEGRRYTFANRTCTNFGQWTSISLISESATR